MAPFTRSTPEEIAASKRLVAETQEMIRRLKAEGKRVHFIWDVDGVLVNSRSDDVFTVLGFDVPRYFIYEERLLAERLEYGPWLTTARGWEGAGPNSQDIVTARSSYLAMRVQFFLLDWEVPIRWQLYVGHQSKADSYRIILQSFAKDPDTHIFMADDSGKNVAAFVEVAASLGMTERCHGIASPVIREYDEAEIRREVAAVLDGANPEIHFVNRKARGITVLPNPRKTMRDVWMGLGTETYKKAVVNGLRKCLTEQAKEIWPDRVPDDDLLFYVYEMTRQP
jgi:hypothetical protein